jgi:hypothetical protein
MPWALIAIAAVQAGYAIYSGQQQQAEAAQAQFEGEERAIKNRNELVERGLKKQRGASSGTLLGGANFSSDSASSTLLNTTGNTTPTSLLGNNL